MCPKNQNISLRTTNSIRIMRNPQSSLPCPTQGAIVFYFLLFLPPVQKHLCVLTQLRFPYEITVFVSTTKDPVLHLKEKLFVKEQLPKAESGGVRSPVQFSSLYTHMCCAALTKQGRSWETTISSQEKTLLSTVSRPGTTMTRASNQMPEMFLLSGEQNDSLKFWLVS